VITCPKCSKDNQDHYKFCLGCGAELPRDAAPKPFTPQTPPHGMKAKSAAPPPHTSAAASTVASAPHQAPAPQPAPAAPAPAPAAQPSAAPAAGTVTCPQCGHVNTPSNMFCGSCGFRLQQAAAPRPAPAAEAHAPGAGILLTALRADGSEAGQFTLPAGGGTVGRETGGVFASDSYLSPRHATFRTTAGAKAYVRDDASLNGVYKKLVRDAPVELKPNDIFRIGQEIIRFEPLAPQPPSPDGVERLGAPSKGYIGRIALVIGRNETGNAFPIPEAGIHLGRERGDVLFPEDGYVSGLHCRLAWEGGKLMLTDLGSSNGTFLRLKEEVEIRTGDVLLMGQQLFRITM
jgi:pSer/pThr/pTyr-binding forkhead associated (FHA) protein